MKARQWLKELHQVCQFMSTSKGQDGGKLQVASFSEVQRWAKEGAILVNGERLDLDEQMDFPIISVVFFPNGKRRTTLY